jgi:hypothetical protein
MGLNRTEWNGSNTDELMDMALAGFSPEEIGNRFSISEKEVWSRFKEGFYNRRYRPSGPRTWRGGMKLGPLEKKLLKRYQRKGYDVSVVGQILQRKPWEIDPDFEGQKKIIRMKELAPAVDLLMAIHYLFHQTKTAIVTDEAYDLKKKEEIEFGADGNTLLEFLDRKPRHVTDYPPHIRALADYLHFKYMKKCGHFNWNKLPYGWKNEKNH